MFCIRYGLEDPRYVGLTSFINEYIGDEDDFDKLRSTLCFGLMALHLAYHNDADILVKEVLTKNYDQDAANDF